MTSGRAPETGAILRALGSLIAALGDGTTTAGSRPVEAATLRAAAGELDRVEREPMTADAPVEDAALLLADARERAQRLLDDSMERARELLARGRVAGSGGGMTEDAAEPLRRSVQELIHTVHDVQERLDRIEALLRDRVDTGRPREEVERRQPPILPPRQSAAPSGLPTSAMPPVRSAQPAYSPPAHLAQTISPTPEPEAAPAPATPWQRPAEATAPVPPAPPPAPPTPPTPIAPPVAASTYAPAELARDDDDAPLATFTPTDGSIVLRATPIAGFQGLMRVQDALARLAEVRQATVEAYAQGEARLRVELNTDVESDQIATALSEAMGQPARVREADEGDRTMLIVFG